MYEYPKLLPVTRYRARHDDQENQKLPANLFSPGSCLSGHPTELFSFYSAVRESWSVNCPANTIIKHLQPDVWLMSGDTTYHYLHLPMSEYHKL